MKTLEQVKLALTKVFQSGEPCVERFLLGSVERHYGSARLRSDVISVPPIYFRDADLRINIECVLDKSKKITYNQISYAPALTTSTNPIELVSDRVYEAGLTYIPRVSLRDGVITMAIEREYFSLDSELELKSRDDNSYVEVRFDIISKTVTVMNNMSIDAAIEEFRKLRSLSIGASELRAEVGRIIPQINRLEKKDPHFAQAVKESGLSAISKESRFNLYSRLPELLYIYCTNPSVKYLLESPQLRGAYLAEIEGSGFNGNLITSVQIPESLKLIGEWAFARNQITNLVIPNSVTNIAGQAFAENDISFLEIGTGVNLVGSGAFARNKLTRIRFRGDVPSSIGNGVFAVNEIDHNSIQVPLEYLEHYRSKAHLFGLWQAAFTEDWNGSSIPIHTSGGLE